MLKLPYNKINTSNYFLVAVILIITAFIFLFNYLYPAVEDDWYYTFVWKPTGAELAGQRITSLHDLFESQYAHYMQWGGRTVAHVITQSLLSIDMIWQDILNTLAYISLMYVMYKYSNIGRRTNVSLFLLISAIFWLFQPIFAATMFWITGSANYLWCTLLILMFIYPYYSLYMKGDSKDSVAKSIGLFLFGIIAGWTNENMVIAVIFFIAVLLFLIRRQQMKIPVWAYVAFTGFIIGSLFLLLSPGNAVRYSRELIVEGASSSLLSVDSLLSRLEQMWNYYRKLLLVYSIPSIVAIAYYYLRGKGEQKNKIGPILLLLFISSHIALAAMIASPTFPERAMFGLICILIILLGLAFANLNMDNKWVRAASVLLVVGLTVASGVEYYKKYIVVRKIHHVVKEREEIMEKGKKLGIKDFVFDNQYVISRRYHFHECVNDPNDSKTIAYCDYYGINSVIIIDRWLKDSVDQKHLELKAIQDSILNAN